MTDHARHARWFRHAEMQANAIRSCALGWINEDGAHFCQLDAGHHEPCRCHCGSEH